MTLLQAGFLGLVAAVHAVSVSNYSRSVPITDNSLTVIVNQKADAHAGKGPAEEDWLLKLVHDKSVIVLTGNKFMPVMLDPLAHNTLEVNDIPTDVTVVVVEFHVQKYNVTLSLYPDPTFTTSVTGTSGGIPQRLAYEAWKATWYLHSSLNDTVKAYLKASFYTNDDPVPGACNQEFPLPIDPNIHLNFIPSIATVAFQFANVGTQRGSAEFDCEDSITWNELQYEVFQYYLDEGDLSENHFHASLEKITSLEMIRHHAQKIHSFSRSSGHSHLKTVAYQGLGVMYNVIVSQVKDGKTRQAMYIARTDYGCEFDGLVDNCYNLESSFLPITKVISIICAGLGVYLCFLGHRFFKLQMCIFGCIAFLLLFYIVLSVTTQLEHPTVVIIAAVIGLAGGALWLAFWWNIGIPVLSELLVGLVFGFLFSAIVFYTPFGLLSIWQSSFNYGMGFACGILVIPVFLLYFTKTLSILSCAVVGAYSLVFCIGLYLRCSIPYIVINAIQKAVTPGFVSAIVTAPFQLFDVILVLIWITLAIIGTVFQFIREKKRPAFPPCPRAARKHNRELQMLAEESADMRRPLLPESRRTYQPSRASQPKNNYGTYRQIDAEEPNEIA